MNKEDKFILNDNKSFLIKNSIFSLTISLIIWVSLSIIFNIFIHIKILEYSDSLINNELSGILNFYENTGDKNIIKKYIQSINYKKTFSFGIILNDKETFDVPIYPVDKIKELMKKNKSNYDSEKIIDKIINLKNYIINIYSNQNFILSLKKSNITVYCIYKPLDLLKNKILIIYIINLFIIISGIIIIILISSFYLRKTFVKPIKKLINKSNLIKQGNLSIDFNNIKRKDEIGHLSIAFKENTETLKDLIENVYKAVLIMNRILNNLFKSSKSVSDSANAQVKTIEETQGNFEKLNSMIKTITEESKRGSNYTMNAYEKTKIGLESIQNLENEMAKIESSSQEISDIIRIINDIAEQTELLSLNASIESARAGESGRGFNVVSGEVRKLAEKTSQAANRVYGLITNNNNLIKAGVNYSKNATKILKEISIANELSASVAKIINEETIKIKQITNEMIGVINYISEVAQANLLESSNVAATTNELSTQAFELQKFIEKFDIRSKQLRDNQIRIEKNLENKLNELTIFVKEKGNLFLPTGNSVKIKSQNKEYSIEEIQLGDSILTGNDEYADFLYKKFDAHVIIFQNLDENLISVSSTIKNYDNSRLTGTMINPKSRVYNNLINGKNFISREFWIDRWYIVAYKPFIDQTGYLQCAIALCIPEDLKIKLNKDKPVESIN